MIVSIDPGTYNSGIAVIEGNIIKLINLPAKDTDNYISGLIQNIDNIENIIIGETKSREIFTELLSARPEIVRTVNEKNSTIEARQLCLKYYLDRFNLVKAANIFFNGSHCDDWAALILYCRYTGVEPVSITKLYKIIEQY